MQRIHTIDELRALKPGDMAMIPHDKIESFVMENPEFQTRFHPSGQAVTIEDRDPLYQSIVKNGVEVAVAVGAPTKVSECLPLVAGFHRIDCLKKANTGPRKDAPLDLPIRVTSAKTPKEYILKSIQDNGQRASITPIDDSYAIRKALEAGASPKEISEARGGISVQRISQLKGLTDPKMPMAVQKAIHAGVSESLSRLKIKRATGVDISITDLDDDFLNRAFSEAVLVAAKRAFTTTDKNGVKRERKPDPDKGESYGVHLCTVAEIEAAIAELLNEVPAIEQKKAAEAAKAAEEAAAAKAKADAAAAAKAAEEAAKSDANRNANLPVGDGDDASGHRLESNGADDTTTPPPVVPPLNEDVENGKRARVLSDVVKLFSDKAAGASPESPMLVLCQQVVAFIEGKASRADVFSAMNDLEHFVPYTERLKIEDQTMQKIANGDKVGSKPAAPKAKSAA